MSSGNKDKGEPLAQRGWWRQWRAGCSHLSAALCGPVPELPFPVAHSGLLPFPSASKECGERLKTTSLGSAVLGKSRQIPSVSSGVGFKKPARESFSWLHFPEPLHPLPAHPLLSFPFLSACLQVLSHGWQPSAWEASSSWGHMRRLGSCCSEPAQPLLPGERLEKPWSWRRSQAGSRVPLTAAVLQAESHSPG